MATITLLVTAAVIAGLSPECQADWTAVSYPASYTYYYDVYYERPMYCYTTFAFVPPVGIFGIVTGSLTFASLSQLSKTSPMHASTSHFQCMIVWAIILTSMNLVVSINMASFASIPSDPQQSYFNCSYYYNPNSDCAQQESTFRAWVKDKRDASIFHRTFYLVVCWLWVGFVVVSIVVQSRMKYWCCRDCKRDCRHCVMRNEDACESCRCCVMAPGEEQSMQQLTVLGGSQNLIPAVVHQPIVQTTEVHFWLTNEIRLPQYTQLFVQKGYDRMDAVMLGVRTEQDLRKIVPNILPGHAVLIMQDLALKRGRTGMVVPTQSQYAAAPAAGGVVAILPMREGMGTV